MLDKRTTDKLNLQVLQRVDPNVEEVLVTAGHVALYHLDVPNMQWVRVEPRPLPNHFLPAAYY